MLDRIENIITRVWNRWLTRRVEPVRDETALDFGVQIIDGEPTRHRITLKQSRRAEHVAILGKTGSGKSFLIRSIAQSDVAAGRGFLLNDFHSDNAAFMVKVIAARERILKRDLSDRLIVIDLADPEFSTALNVLEERSTEDRFVHIAEITEILKNHWHLDSFGARTDELLRFSLYVLAENRLTLIELALLLSDAEFRSRCLEKVTNSEVKQYFEL
ncbi:MAG: ATP-binding protein, partial [Acidobacteriia bacterium]|nr:ATP-binding protein [Terriglobia bacterium]